jgi:hypothetical protein
MGPGGVGWAQEHDHRVQLGGQLRPLEGYPGQLHPPRPAPPRPQPKPAIPLTNEETHQGVIPKEYTAQACALQARCVGYEASNGAHRASVGLTTSMSTVDTHMSVRDATPPPHK